MADEEKSDKENEKDDTGLRLAKILSSIEFKFWQSDGLLKPGLLHYGFIFVVLAGLISAGRYEYFGKWQIPSSAVSSLLTTMLQIAAAYLIQFFPQTPIQQRYYGLLYTLTVVTSMALIIFILTNIDKANKLVDWLYDLELSEWAVAIFYGLAGSLLFLVMTSVRNRWLGRSQIWLDGASVFLVILYACFASTIIWLFVLAEEAIPTSVFSGASAAMYPLSSGTESAR